MKKGCLPAAIGGILVSLGFLMIIRNYCSLSAGTTEKKPQTNQPITTLSDAPSKVSVTPSSKLIKPQTYQTAITPKSWRSKIVTKHLRERLIREFSNKGMSFGAPVYLRILKKERLLEIWVKRHGHLSSPTQFKHFKTYPIAAMSGHLGPKLAEGDRQAPEGFYFVQPQALNPNSRFHLSFNLGYPNAYDRAHRRTGSALMVHGSRVSIGCFAMTNKGIEEIYSIIDAALSAGQPFFRVHIFPFKMTDENLAAHKKSPHYYFWLNLQTGSMV